MENQKVINKTEFTNEGTGRYIWSIIIKKKK
jgi:hypothetical protein